MSFRSPTLVARAAGWLGNAGQVARGARVQIHDGRSGTPTERRQYGAHVSCDLAGATGTDPIHRIQGARPRVAGLLDAALERLCRTEVPKRYGVRAGEHCRLAG